MTTFKKNRLVGVLVGLAFAWTLFLTSRWYVARNAIFVKATNQSVTIRISQPLFLISKLLCSKKYLKRVRDSSLACEAHYLIREHGKIPPSFIVGQIVGQGPDKPQEEKQNRGNGATQLSETPE